MKIDSLLRRMGKGKEEGRGKEAGWGPPGIKQLLSWRGLQAAEAGPSSEERGGSLQEHPPYPKHLQPPARQATRSIMNEACLIIAGLKTGTSWGLSSRLVLAQLACLGSCGVVAPGKMAETTQILKQKPPSCL